MRNLKINTQEYAINVLNDANATVELYQALFYRVFNSDIARANISAIEIKNNDKVLFEGLREDEVGKKIEEAIDLFDSMGLSFNYQIMSL